MPALWQAGMLGQIQMATATSPSLEYEAVAIPEQDPPGLKRVNTHRKNRKHDQKTFVSFSLVCCKWDSNLGTMQVAS